MKEYFNVNISKYDPTKNFFVCRPASLNRPKDGAVMFITPEYMKQSSAFSICKNCLVFWPKNYPVPEDVYKNHAVVRCDDTRKEYCRFFRDNHITYYPKTEKYNLINGAFIAEGAIIGENCTVFPGAYIGGEVKIGNNVFIGGGVRLVGEIIIGNNAVIRENTVIGADGLSNDRDENGCALTMPQFGSVIIEDDVQIGAMTVIARGAIDSTIIKRGSKIDNCCFISHNVLIGEDVFVVGETIMCGSSSAAAQSYISANATIRDGRHIGRSALVGMGSVVTKDVAENSIVKGNPAK